MTIFIRYASYRYGGDRKASDVAIADYTWVIRLPGAPPAQVAEALYERGHWYYMRNESDAAIADYTRIIELPGAPREIPGSAIEFE